MDSSTMTGSPAATASPALRVIRKAPPVMWALTSSGIQRSLFDHLGMDTAGPERRAREHPSMERDDGADPLHDEAIERRRHPRDGLLPRLAPGDELGQERI